MVRPLGRVKYDSLQVSVNRRMTNGLAVTRRYTYAKATDWWAGGILIPEYWDLNKGTQGGNTPHKVDMSAIYELPFGAGQEVRRTAAVCSAMSLAGWQMNSYFTAYSGTPFSDLGQQRVAEREQPAARRSGESRTSRSSAASAWTSPYFDATAFKPVTEARFGTAGFNTLRGPERRQPRHELLPHVQRDVGR